MVRRPPLFALVRLLGACLLAAAGPLGAAALTLDDAIRLALERNQALKVSAFNPQIARANLLAEYGRFDPAVVFTRTRREVESPGLFAPGSRPLSRDDHHGLELSGLTPWGLSYRLETTADRSRGGANFLTGDFSTFGGVSVTQPLLRDFGFAANLGSLRIAKADRKIADWQHRATVIDTVTSVVFLYNDVLQAQEAVRIARLSRELTEKLVEQNRARNRIGVMSDAEVIQASARLATRDEQILSNERNARNRENAFRQLIGETHYPVDGPPLQLEPLPLATPVTLDPAADLKRAYLLRPDYQAARLGIDQVRYSEAIARNQLLPALDLVGSYGYAGEDPDFAAARRQVRDRDARAYSLGVVVTIPLTFAQGRGRLQAARLATRRSEADLVQLEQNIALDIAAAAGEVETTRRRVTVSRNALELAQHALTAEEKKLDAGSGRTLDVLQAQEQLASAQNALVRAMADERRARASYERELGATLEIRNLTLE